MFKHEEKFKNTDKADKINKQNQTNPISAGNYKGEFVSINMKIESLLNAEDINVKRRGISDLVDAVYLLSAQELVILMSSNNEIVRGIASRALVDKNPDNLVLRLKNMMKDKCEYIRDAAVSSLCYLNSPQVIDLLEKATEDSSVTIRLKALTGIADLASEYSDIPAKDILQRFASSDVPEIKEFVNDELSILP